MPSPDIIIICIQPSSPMFQGKTQHIATSRIRASGPLVRIKSGTLTCWPTWNLGSHNTHQPYLPPKFSRYAHALLWLLILCIFSSRRLLTMCITLSNYLLHSLHFVDLPVHFFLIIVSGVPDLSLIVNINSNSLRQHLCMSQLLLMGSLSKLMPPRPPPSFLLFFPIANLFLSPGCRRDLSQVYICQTLLQTWQHSDYQGLLNTHLYDNYLSVCLPQSASFQIHSWVPVSFWYFTIHKAHLHFYVCLSQSVWWNSINHTISPIV